jgi:NADH-quinone oxidoreductase subunit N
VITGLFASALLLYGISLVYGAAGDTGLHQLAALARGGEADALVLAGFAFIAAGLAFKMGAAPFQMWMPDVLEGAPTRSPATSPSAPRSRARGRGLVAGFRAGSRLGPGLVVAGRADRLWGNLAALAQTSLMHAGVPERRACRTCSSAWSPPGAPLATGTAGILSAAMPMNFAFGALLWFERATAASSVRDLAGFGRRYRRWPLMSVFMLSLAGIPPTAGFPAKFWVFLEGWNAGYHGLVLVALLGSAIGAYYYLRAIYALYLLPDPEDAQALSLPSGFALLASAILLAAVGTALAGIMPQVFISCGAGGPRLRPVARTLIGQAARKSGSASRDNPRTAAPARPP